MARPAGLACGAAKMERCACLALLAAATVAMVALVEWAPPGPVPGIALLMQPASIEYIRTQTQRVDQMNARLAREDKALAAEEKAEEMRVIAMKKGRQEALEREHETAVLQQNAKLQLENAKLRQQMLIAKLAAKRARINEMKEQVRTGGFRLKGRGLLPLPKTAKARPPPSRSTRASKGAVQRRHRSKVEVSSPLGVRFVAKDPFVMKRPASTADVLAKVTSPRGEEWEARKPMALPAASRASPLGWLGAAKPKPARRREVKPTQKLVGQYVKACEKGKGCHMVYLPETMEHWDAANHTEKVMESGLGVPVGPARRVPISPLANPQRDTARPEPDHSIYGVFTGSFFGPGDKDFQDNFVPLGRARVWGRVRVCGEVGRGCWDGKRESVGGCARCVSHELASAD